MGYDLSFSVNLYNEFGDLCEENIQLHLNNGTILSFKNITEYNNFIEQMKGLRNEIIENISHLKND